MITMMFGFDGLTTGGFDPASLEMDAPEATVALAMMAAVISRIGKQCLFMSVNFDGF